MFTSTELENHLLVCEYKSNGGGVAGSSSTIECTFQYCGCLWRGSGKEELESHVKEALNSHLEMMVTAFRMGQNLGGVENHSLWDAPAKRANGDGGHGQSQEQMDLIRGMYERIVVLEQQYREQMVKVDKLTETVARMQQIEAKPYDGVLIWRVEQFRSKIDSMSNNPNVLLYSPEAYTSPHGYKYCVRLNISPKVS